MLIPIIEFEGRYLHRVKGASRYYVSKCGAIYSTFCNRLLKPTPQTDGYLQVGLKRDDGRKWRPLAHCVVALQFIHNPDPARKRFVNHRNANKHDNRARNLEWVTSKENDTHAREMGLSPRYTKAVALPIIRGLCASVQHDQIIPRFYHFEPVPTSCPKSDTDASRA